MMVILLLQYKLCIVRFDFIAFKLGNVSFHSFISLKKLVVDVHLADAF